MFLAIFQPGAIEDNRGIFDWGQAVYPLWCPSWTKDLQTEPRCSALVWLDRCRVPGSQARTMYCPLAKNRGETNYLFGKDRCVIFAQRYRSANKRGLKREQKYFLSLKYAFFYSSFHGEQQILMRDACSHMGRVSPQIQYSLPLASEKQRCIKFFSHAAKPRVFCFSTRNWTAF